MDDRQILARIRQLDDQERDLRSAAEGRGLTDDEHSQLTTAEETLDQLWDLLRQRRARREFGQDPDDATLRDKRTVERYEQ